MFENCTINGRRLTAEYPNLEANEFVRGTDVRLSEGPASEIRVHFSAGHFFWQGRKRIRTYGYASLHVPEHLTIRPLPPKM